MVSRTANSTKYHKKYVKHDIQLQVADSMGFAVAGTEFWITVTIIKQGKKVTVQFPLINFVTG